MEQLNKQTNETKYEYIKRLVLGKLDDKTVDLEYEELSELIFGDGNCYNSSEVRKRFYGMKHLINAIESEKIENVSDNEIADEINIKIRELQKERVKLQTEKSENNKWIREVARTELYLEKLEEAIKHLTPIEVPEMQVKINNNYTEGLVTISDIHFGRKACIKGLKGEIISEYNEDVFENRMWKLLDETVSIIKKENLSKITVVNCGDIIDGILRQSQLQSLQYGIIDSVMKFSDFFALWLNELSKYAYIEYYSANGNHDQIRPLGSKNGDFPNENVCKIIHWYLKTRLKDNSNVSINISDSEFGFFNILGLSIMATHGEEGNLEQAIKDYSMIYKESIDLLLCGHLHSGYSKSVGMGQYNDIEVIRVPSLCGIDDYSMKLRKSAFAGSKLFIFEEGKGKTVTYDIVLK